MARETMHECSPLDSMIPALFNALILTFPCGGGGGGDGGASGSEEGGHDGAGGGGDKDSLLKLLQTSLDQTVAERSYLVAEIASLPPQAAEIGTGTLRLHHASCSANRVVIEVNDLTADSNEWPHEYDYDRLREDGMPPSRLCGRVLAPLAGYQTCNKVMAVRANFIPNGLLLVVYFHHSVLDAWGASLVMSAWAEKCARLQGLDLSSGHSNPLNAPTALVLPPALRLDHIVPSEDAYEVLKCRPELWQSLSLDWARRPKAPPFVPGTAMTTCIFNASESALQRLKTDASMALPVSADPTRPAFISTADALGALLWRCILKARYTSAGREATRDSVINVALDGRKALNIPIDYPGNVVFGSITTMSVDQLTSPNTSLGDIAAALRESLESAKQPARLADALRMASSLPAGMDLQYAIPDWSVEDVILTSWTGLPFYEHRWGPAFGPTERAEFFRMPTGQFEGICSVQPRRLNGSVDIVVGLEPHQMESFRGDHEIRDYLTFVAQ